MSTDKTVSSHLVRNRSGQTIKQQAVLRADRDGIPKAAADFGIAESTLDAWRENIRLGNEVAFLNCNYSA